MSWENFESVFRENFSLRGELGASVSVWKNGIELVSFSEGWRERERNRVWDSETLVPFYSATKAPAAATLLYALSLHGLDELTLVSEIWPSFPLPQATFSELLSHQCGLAALEGESDVFDHRSVILAVENQLVEGDSSHGHGYHPRTIGFLMDECVRRLTGQTLGRIWNEEIAKPLGIEFWIGLDLAQFHRVAKLVPGRAKFSASEEIFYREFNKAESFTRKAFSSPKGLQAIADMNDPKAWAAGIASMGGVGSASGLAKFYQAVIGGIDSPFPSGVKNALSALQVSGEDRVLLRETAFTCGCQKDPVDSFGNKKRQTYGSSTAAFGHPGAGGSHGFGDPLSGVSFAYGMNQMELNVMPGERCMMLVEQLSCLV